jgi:hypothetical protein
MSLSLTDKLCYNRGAKTEGSDGVARATVLEEGGVQRYQTMGVVTVELPRRVMGEVVEISG